jgi:hypothetical protein
VPIGYLVTAKLVACCTLFALAPMRRPAALGRLSSILGFFVNEMPFVTFYWLLASTLLAIGQGDIDSPGGWVALGVAVVATAGLAVVAWRGLQAGPAIDSGMSKGLGAGWRSAIDPEMTARLRRSLPWARILFTPFIVRRRAVPLSSTCTVELSSAVRRTTRRVPSSTVSQVRVGSASARTTA